MYTFRDRLNPDPAVGQKSWARDDRYRRTIYSGLHY